MSKRTLQTIFRVIKNRDNPYAQINKKVLEDPRLSYKAKGIMAYLLSRPDDWIVRHKDLVNRSTDGKDSVSSGLKELKQLGYLQELVWRDKNRIAYREILIFEDPSHNPFPKEKWGKQVHVQLKNRSNGKGDYPENPDKEHDYPENPDKEGDYPDFQDEGFPDEGFPDEAFPDYTNKKNLPKVDSYHIRNLNRSTFIDDWKRIWDNARKGN